MSTQPRDHVQQPSFQPINWSWPDQLRLHWVVWVFALVVAVLTWVRLPEGGNDWIRGAALAARDWWPAPWLHNFPLAPWGALLFSPVATAPDRLGTVIGNFLSVIVLAMVIRRFGGPDWIVVLVMLTPAGYFLLINGQQDWLSWLGLLFFNGLDVLLIVIKPQIAIGVLVSRVRRAGKAWLRYLLPAIIFGLLSLVIWPLWPIGVIQLARNIAAGPSNYALWPWGIPAGLFLLWYAWRTGDDRWGIVATPFLFPYINIYSYLLMLAVLAARWPRPAIAVWALIWIVGFGMALMGIVR